MQRNANLVDLENPEKMRLLSLSEVSIQPRTSPPKFLKNRGVRMGVSGDIVRELDKTQSSLRGSFPLNSALHVRDTSFLCYFLKRTRRSLTHYNVQYSKDAK